MTVAFGDDLKKPFVNCQIKIEANIGNQIDERFELRLVFDIYNRKYIEGKNLLYLGVLVETTRKVDIHFRGNILAFGLRLDLIVSHRNLRRLGISCVAFCCFLFFYPC